MDSVKNVINKNGGIRIRVAIIGSKIVANPETARKVIKEILDVEKPSLVISGGCQGIDTIAIEEAKKKGIKYKEFFPEIKRWNGGGKIGFKERNLQIAEECDILYRIYNKNTTTYGSGWTADMAEKLGKKVVRIVSE